MSDLLARCLAKLICIIIAGMVVAIVGFFASLAGYISSQTSRHIFAVVLIAIEGSFLGLVLYAAWQGVSRRRRRG